MLQNLPTHLEYPRHQQKEALYLQRPQHDSYWGIMDEAHGPPIDW